MEKNILFDTGALIVMCILLVSTIFRRMTKGKNNRWYLVIMISCMAATVADIVAILLDNSGVGYEMEKYIFHTLYLALHNLVTPFYLWYIVLQADTRYKFKRSPWQMVLLIAPISMIVVNLLINLATKHIFYIDERGNYIRGQFFLLLYMMALIYVIHGIWYTLYYRKNFRRSQLIAMLSVYPLMLAAVIIQLFFKTQRVEMFANACSMMFISLIVQRPEELIDNITGLGKISAYVADIRRGFRNKKPMEIVMINVVNHDTLQDMLGYDGMNSVLKKVAREINRLNQREKLEADAYYLGNGKFRIVLEYEHFHQTVQVAEYMNTYMRDEFKLKHMELNMITCVCVTRCPEDIEDLDSLLVFGGDINAKKYTGEVLFASELYKKEYYDIMKDIDRIIEQALANHSFSVYYQPIYSVKEKRFNSAEALLRLKDEKYGFISPEIFIPAAEKSGAINRIGDFVLEEVCKFINSEEYKALNLEYIEINLSVVQCMQSSLSKRVLKLLEKYEIRPEQINLEITETAATDYQKIMEENLRILSEAGISFSLDDFGTGYSNMCRIASLPLQIVKLDKSFTNVEEENTRLLLVLQNTIKMIKAMNMQIVVEGIETENMVKQFTDLQCEYIQGYYYSKPVPKDEFVEFIQSKM